MYNHYNITIITKDQALHSSLFPRVGHLCLSVYISSLGQNPYSHQPNIPLPVKDLQGSPSLNHGQPRTALETLSSEDLHP
jgi:hypothetical protein